VTEREALLHAIRLEPDEDTPRLVYADWLDEHGDESDWTHAEQIRVQIEFPAERIEIPWRHPTIPDIKGWVSRGFVAQIDLRTQLYLNHAEDLFREHPITLVALTDKRPLLSAYEPWAAVWEFAGGIFSSPNPWELPGAFMEPMLAHPLRVPDLAEIAFEWALHARLSCSEIAVNLGRKPNHLPPLPLTSRPPRSGSRG
jgi:uncharacterized protein (TIGR02996 family)